MSEQYEFTVCLKDISDKNNFVQQMSSDVKILDSHIPPRPCEPNEDNREYIKYNLSHDEVKQLRKDSRVLGIYQHIPGGVRRTLEFDKQKLSKVEIIAQKSNSVDLQNTLTFSGDEFAIVDLPETTGIDMVIVDSWVAPNHEEFTESSVVSYGGGDSSYISKYTETNPESRVYTLTNASNKWNNNSLAGLHGTHVAGTAAGKTQGWCRQSRIVNIDFLNFATQNRNDSDLLTWHNFKKNNNINRPTLVNHSWGYSYPDLPVSHLIEIEYRGVTYTSSNFPPFPTFSSSEGYLDRVKRVYQEYLSFFLDKGICFYEVDDTIDGCILAPLPLVDTFTDSVIEDHIDAGMIVCCAAGNEGWAIVDPSSQDWNNVMYFTIPGGGSTQYQLSYNQGGSPNRISRNTDNSIIIVGAIRSKNYKAHFSSCGSAITVYAPGEDIISSVKPTDSTQSGLFGEHTYLDKLSGTSMASPQTCGVLGLMAQKQINDGSAWPMNTSSAQASGVAYLSSYSYNNIYDSNIDSSGTVVVAGKPEIYEVVFPGNTQAGMSLKGSNNRCLFFDASISRCGNTLDKPPCLWQECDNGSGSGSGSGGVDTGSGGSVFLPLETTDKSEQTKESNQSEKTIEEIIDQINEQTSVMDNTDDNTDYKIDKKWWWL